MVAALTASEAVTFTSDGGSTHTFTENGTFTFAFTDAAGNAGAAIATVDHIDRIAPVITLGRYDSTTPTNDDIVVDASTDEGTLNAASHTFSANGSFDFVATDAAGNATTKTVTITNIDKTAPTASISYDITAPTGSDVVATLHPSEEVTVTSDGGSTHTFAANGSFTFEFVDAAGNTGSATASVSNIDKSAKDIASFIFTGLNPQVTGSISGTSIALTVPYGTDVTALVPTIVITGASVSPASGLAQDFSTPKEYAVTAADGSSRSYTATVSIAPAPSAGFLLPTPSSVSASGSDMRVKATQQGTLTQSLDENSKIKLHVPRGSVASTTIFEISKGELAEGDKPADHSGAFLFDGMIFNINARDAAGNAVRSFSQDLTITLIVDDLPQDVSGIKLYYFDEAAGRWTIIEDITFSGNTIVFSVNHLTKFALFGTEPTGEESGRVLGGRTVLLEDGDIIQCRNSSNPNAVYTVRIKNGKTYIRHIVSLEIFNHYRHLRWERLKQVDSLEGYISSAWVRVNTGLGGQASPQDKVYEINGDQTRHWIDMTAQEFLQHGGSEEAVYAINQGELNLYKEGAAVKLMQI